MNNTETTYPNAGNCNHCGAFNNVRCGCAASRKARGEKPAPVVSLDDIEIELPPRRKTRLS